MGAMKQENNKALVLEAFDTLFNKRDYASALRFWSPNYIQHSAHIGPGREGLFHLVESLPSTLRYEPGTIIADEEFVIVHGRYSGFGQPTNWIVADIVRIAGRTLGCDPGRGNAGEVQERPSHVRNTFPGGTILKGVRRC